MRIEKTLYDKINPIYSQNTTISLIDDLSETDTAGSYIDLTASKSGRFSLVFGNGVGYADYMFTTAGVLTLIVCSNNVFESLQTGTAHVLIKAVSSTTVRITNLLGTPTIFNVKVQYTN